MVNLFILNVLKGKCGKFLIKGCWLNICKIKVICSIIIGYVDGVYLIY